MSTFKEKVIYQIYPKSFKDTNGDGIGDLRGIIEKIPYLATLGIDMIWLNPIYPSPQKDNGYDIQDYQTIDALFGTMEDFEILVQRAKAYEIELMLDMVFNHVSTSHPWFQRALSGDEFYQQFFYIRPPKEDGQFPTNWQSKFGGPAWAPFGDTGLYYLHLYDESQADLNWHNPHVRAALMEVVNFWKSKGVKGFRFDVLNVIGKSEWLQDSTGSVGDEKALYTDTPIVHKFVRELIQNTIGDDSEIVTVGEMSSTTVEQGVQYTNPENQELNMIFSFHHLKVDYQNGEKWTDKKMDFQSLKKALDDWQQGMQQGNGWNALFWNNHDQPRANSRFANPEKYPYESSTLLATTIHLLRGTPFIYQGEEIGMTNPKFRSMNQYRDVETLNAYQELCDKGYDADEVLSIIQQKSRDNSRTPMQWDSSSHSGFTTGIPWLVVADNYTTVNVEREMLEGRIFEYYQQLIQLRKEYPVIIEGTYRMIQQEHPTIFAYERKMQKTRLIVLNHFFEGEAYIDLSSEKIPWAHTRVLITNGREVYDNGIVTLSSYQSIVFLVQE